MSDMQARAQEVWVINTFTVNPGEKAEDVAALQLELVSKVKNGWPGFISQETLIARDGRTVTTVEAWENFDTLKAIAEHPSLIAYRERIQRLASMSPVLYRLGGSSHVKQP